MQKKVSVSRVPGGKEDCKAAAVEFLMENEAAPGLLAAAEKSGYNSWSSGSPEAADGS